jgi:MinD-like ATPase involved in chromosome partitioning or flagellar assembly
MLTVVASGKASPGVTTSTWALALSWPRPLMVADCDPAGGDMAPGLLAGRVSLDRGLLSWSTAARRGLPATATATLLAEHAVEVPERPQVSLIPGFATATQGTSFTPETWERLALALERSAVATGRDVLVDAGRLVTDRGCWPVLRAADQVLLAVRPSVRSVHAAHDAVQRLRHELGDLEKVAALVVGDGPYAAGEVARALQLPLGGVLPYDRTAAEILSDGALSSPKALRRAALMRAASSLAGKLGDSSGASSVVEAVAG